MKKFVLDLYEGGYAPHFNIEGSLSHQKLGGDWKNSLYRFSFEYFYKWHQDIWRQSAQRKFPRMKAASRMLICGEDLGLLAPVVPEVMRQFNIMGLRVQRMPADPAQYYYHPSTYEEATVATTSTHDMPPLRAWWQGFDSSKTKAEEYYSTNEGKENGGKIDCFWWNTLINHSSRPYDLPNDQLERIID
ncbi:MAG: 4-alpha-glucanotransferase, partial [Streblomastix strix]